MNITVVGAGNIGTQIAVHTSYKGYKTTLYTSKPQVISKILEIVDENDKTFMSAEIFEATDNVENAFADADVIFVTMPSFCHKGLAEKIFAVLKKGVLIGLIPGTGGGECAFKKCIDNGAIVFGLQRVPSVARLVEYGKKVKAIGYRNELFVSAIPKKYSDTCAKFLQDIFDIKCTVLKNYLSLSLTPSNPILHTARLKVLFNDYNKGKVYPRESFFYEEWDDETSNLIISCDNEVQLLYNALKQFDFSDVKSLKEHYESYTISDFTNKIRSIQGFKGIKTPMKQVEGGYIPDFDSRYFSADFPYGLSIFIQIADFVGLDVPYMKQIMQWYKKHVKCFNEFDFSDYGINNFNQFVEFYKR